MSAIPIEQEPARGSSPTLRVMTSRRVALILFNLGGPDSLRAVRPFLFNLFNDRAIIGAPQPFRFLLAQLISRARAKTARANYEKIGGSSPLLRETQKQCDALEQAISKKITNITFRCFPAMRYWRPFVKQAAKAAAEWGATDAVLLPLYPQFSSATTASSLAAWRRASSLPSSAMCCYPAGRAFAEAHAEAVLAAWRQGGEPARPRVLFSAHGLPQRIVDRGDPYQWQVEQSVAAVRKLLPATWESRICYQSRVGPLKWLGPSTEDEIRAAGRDGAGVIVSPISFVSEHVETLFELDIEYAHIAREAGAPFYLRAPALGAASRFIDALADLVEMALRPGTDIQSETGGRLCPAEFKLCAQGRR